MEFRKFVAIIIALTLILSFAYTTYAQFFEEFEEKFEDKELKEMMKKEMGDKRYEFKGRIVMHDFGPSYEGYNKEEILFSKVFNVIGDDLNPREIKQFCGEPEKIADIVISKLKDKIGSVENVCEDFEKEERLCEERAKESCNQIGQPDLNFARDERERIMMLASSCPPNKDAIVQQCILGSKESAEDNLFFMEENCKDQWEDYGQFEQENCERMLRDNICEEDAYIKQCLDNWGIKKEDFEKKPVPQPICPVATVPQCLQDENLESFYDNNGCLYYQCVKRQIICPDVKIPECAGTLNVNYDSNGCIVGYECVKHAVCGDNICQVDFETEQNCPVDCKKCPYTEAEAERIVNECLNKNGAPQKIYENNCIIDIKCTIQTTQTTENTSGNLITGQVVLETYEDFVNECKRNWHQQKEFCNTLPKDCGKDGFISKCIENQKKSYEDYLKDVEKHCERDSRVSIRHMERQCSRMDAERQRCLEQSGEMCGKMQGIASECREKINEENLRNFIIREAEKMCKFMPYVEEKDFSKFDRMEVILAVLNTVSEEQVAELGKIISDLEKKFELESTIIYRGKIKPNDFVELKKLSFVVNAKLSSPESALRAKEVKEAIVSGQKPKIVVERLLELRDIDVPDEYLYLIENKADDLLDVSEDLDEIGQKEGEKGFAYKIRLFLGFAKNIEEDEIKSLELSKQRLETSIKALGKLADEVPDDIAKAILKEQVAELERQKEDIDNLIKSKERKAKGLLRLFGLFG